MSEHRNTFVHLVTEHGWKCGAELGVDKGILFGQLLRANPDLTLIGVDTFPDRERSKRVFRYAEEFGSRARVLEMTTAEAAKQIEDGSLDFVFIDADHSYEAVKDDIAKWTPKVKAGGWIGGHDYHPRKFPGVVKAVNEAFGWKHLESPGTIWGLFL